MTYQTSGQIAKYSGLTLTYTGTLANNKWISLVDASLESNNPCTGGIAYSAIGTALGWRLRGLHSAMTPADGKHSSPKQAGDSNKLVTVDTMPLDTTKTFAVCYTEGTGVMLDSWYDSGVRFTISKVSTVVYGEATGRTARITTSGVFNGNDQFPQVAGLTLRYTGDLADNKWVALVDARSNSNKPCEIPATAAATADATHTGAVRAPGSSKTVTIPQSTLLTETDAPRTNLYALCYAETDGSTTDATWADSWIRFGISKVQSVSVTSGGLEGAFSFGTYGSVAKTATLKMTYTGTLGNNGMLTLVDNALNSGRPCIADYLSPGGQWSGTGLADRKSVV